jgi:EAL domain-containing protein (putative c-di-GMP-specific phosphodiesterase class I)
MARRADSGTRRRAAGRDLGAKHPARHADERCHRRTGPLHLQTLAEGIESVDQSTQLIVLGGTYGQGYLFARPTAPEDVEALLGIAAG